MSKSSRGADAVSAPRAATPIGVISLGSNDLHLLVAAVDASGAVNALYNQAILAELAGALQDGALPVSALCLAMGHLDELNTAARGAGAISVFILATEVMREAHNGQALLDLVAATLGAQTFLLSGEEEAALDYRCVSVPTAPATMTLVVDSGGASTQVILGAGPTPTFMTSLPIGAGALTRQYVQHDPPKPREMRALRERAAEALRGLPANTAAPEAAILIGGSADHLARFAGRPKSASLTRSELDHALTMLQIKSADEIARKFKLPVERARLLPAGASILSAILAHYNCDEAQIKADGIRGGFLVSYARDGADWRARLIAR